MGNKRSSAKKLMCVLCASLQSIVGASVAAPKRGRSRKRVVNYQGTKFQFLRNMGGMSVRQKKKKGFIRGAIDIVTNHPIASAAVALPSALAIAKGGELACKGIYRVYYRNVYRKACYGYLRDFFNLEHGRISKMFDVLDKCDSLDAGLGEVLDNLCGKNGVYGSDGKIKDDKSLDDARLVDVKQLDGALFLLSEVLSSGKMKNGYFYDVMQNLKRKIVPGCSEYDSYKSLSKDEGLEPDQISSRHVVKDNGGFGGFARFAAGYGEFKQKSPFNPFPLIYLIRKYIEENHLSDLKEKKYAHMVDLDLVNGSEGNTFVSDNKGKAEVEVTKGKAQNENFFSLTRTGDTLTIEFLLSEKNYNDGKTKPVKEEKAKRVKFTYTIPGGKEVKDIKDGKRWEGPNYDKEKVIEAKTINEGGEGAKTLFFE